MKPVIYSALFVALLLACSSSSGVSADAHVPRADFGASDGSADTAQGDLGQVDLGVPDLALDTAAVDISPSKDQGTTSDVSTLPAGKNLWSKRFGGSESEVGHGIGADAQGNVYVTGYFHDGIDLGGGILKAGGPDDIFVASYTANGTYRWSKVFGQNGHDHGLAIAVDAKGNSYITGYFQYSIDFGGGVLTDAGLSDIFTVSFDSDGKHRWSKRFGSINNELPYNVAVDAQSNVYFTGIFQREVDFGGGLLKSAGGFDAYLVSFSSAGVYRWSKRFGSTETDYAHGVGADAQGNVYVQGAFKGTVNFGGGDLSSNGPDADLFIASYTINGVHRWSKRYGGVEAEQARGAAVDGKGNMYITGQLWGDANLGGALLKNAGSSDIYLASYDSKGDHRWSKRFGGAKQDTAAELAVDHSGNVFLVGSFYESIEMGHGLLTSAGSVDMLIASYDSEGGPRWSKSFGDTSSDRAHGVALSPLGQLLVIGEFQMSVDFGGGVLTSAGYADAVVLSFTP